MTKYHHGDLRSAVLRSAAEVIQRDGPSGLSLRVIAHELGVSHTAFRHHFGSREGVLNALAIEGHELLAAKLNEIAQMTGSFLEIGVGYVLFAREYPGHFMVMFSPDLLDLSDPNLLRAREQTFAILRGGVDSLAARGAADLNPGPAEDAAAAVIAGWSLVHGLASLALTGNLDAADIRSLVSNGDLESIARRAAGMLYGSPGNGTPDA